MTPELKAFLKLLGALAALGLFLALIFWPYIAMWASETFGF